MTASERMISELDRFIQSGANGQRRCSIWHLESDLTPEDITRLQSTAEARGWEFLRENGTVYLIWSRGLPRFSEIKKQLA